MFVRPEESPIMNPRRQAFTLVELLVVIAIIGMLVSILLPAVQSAREAGRRTVCKNNLRQIGIGLQSHHVSLGEFPIGGIEIRWQGIEMSKRQLAWSAFLLPYVEEQLLFDRLDLNSAFDSEANEKAAASIIPLYICPTSPDGERLIDDLFGPSDYGGIYGERITSPNDPPKGAMLYDTAISAAHIKDGLSHTLIVAEDTSFPDGQWINGRNIFDQAVAINQAEEWENDIRSHHPGGAQGVRADGSVHFMDESMDLEVLAALCTRDGKDPAVR